MLRYSLKGTLLFIVLLFCLKGYGQSTKPELLFSEDFEGVLNQQHWRAEIEPVGESAVYSRNGQLILNTAGGVTVWFTQKLEGNIRIEYDWTVLVDGGKNDRLSDLNQFWMATDPRNANLFTRSGKFEEYDSLSLYYVGFGGNSNTTTRFRKYHGNGQKPLLKEFTDKEHLLKPNHKYHITIKVRDGRTTFSVDGKVIFDWNDTSPLTVGYFGFRSTASRHAIDNFRVWKML
jgi:rhamnogalacturonan endolyase